MTRAHSRTTLAHDGFTLVEVLIVVLVIGILAAISAPFLLAAKASANEASAIGTLRALNSAQATYATTCAAGRYASSLTQLVANGLGSADMDLSPKSGFSFDLQPRGVAGAAGCDGGGSQSAYYAWAQPLSATTGTRGFATNQEGALWQDSSGAAPTEPFTPSATVSPLGK